MLLLLLSQKSYAGVGTTGANFLKIGVGARAASMGEAYLGLSDDSTGMNWNPAGLADVNYTEVSLMHLAYFADITYENIAVAMPFRGQGIGFGLTWLNVAPFNSTLDPAAVAGSASDFSLSGAYAINFTKALRLGVVARAFNSSLATTSAFGGSLDGGAQFLPFGRSLVFAAVAQNLGVQTGFESGGDPLPIGLRLGVAWRLYNDSDLNVANFILDVNKSIDNKIKYNLGSEFWMFDTLAIRAGYKLAEGGQDFKADDFSAPANFTAGAGFKLNAANIDYAFVPLGELGFTHRVSMSWKFGYKPKTVDKEQVISATPKFGKLQGSDKNGVAFNLDAKKALGDTPLKEWKVEIKDQDGKVVRVLRGAGVLPKNLAWDLKSKDGSLIGGDKPLSYAVTLRDINGRAVTTGGFIAKEVRPKEMLDSTPKYDAAAGGLVFKPKTNLSVGVKEWKVNIRAKDGSILKTLSGTGALPKSLVWKPETSSMTKGGSDDLLAGRTVQAVNFDIEIKDNAGQSKVISDSVRFAMGKAEEKTYRLPLPVREFKVNRGKEVLIAALPNLTSADVSQAKSAPFVMTVPRAQGVRSWRFEITTPDGRVVRTYKGASELPENIFWDGLDDSGVMVTAPEKCRFSFWVVDRNNKQLSTTDRKAVRNPFTLSSAQGNIQKITGLWFRFLDTDIQDAIIGKLKEIAIILRRNPNVQVTIQGHAWDEGSAGEVLRLSQERADMVLRYLIESEGLSPKNVSAIGYGDTMPIKSGKDEKSADLNRRVEVIIVSK